MAAARKLLRYETTVAENRSGLIESIDAFMASRARAEQLEPRSSIVGEWGVRRRSEQQRDADSDSGQLAESIIFPLFY